MEKNIDIDEIKKIIPHRYPFLFVDRITELGDNYIAGYKNVSQDEPFFQGHFPDRPIMPGVLIIEALAQTGAIYMMRDEKWRGKIPLFLGIEKARFRKPVLPGDRLRLEVKIVQIWSNFVKMEGTASVDGNTVCEATLMAGTT